MLVTEFDESATCEVRIEDEIEVLLAKHGMSQTSTYFPSREVGRQAVRYPGTVCPDRAFALAVRALLNDDGREALENVGAFAGASNCDARCYFDRQSSLFGIVADESAPLTDRLLPDSPSADNVRDHWTFFLSVPDLSEHGYWALVARDGSGVKVVSEN